MLLELNDVHAAYGLTKVLNGVNLQVEKGSLVTMVGPNGAGKTTTLRTICGLLPISKGEIIFQGQRIDKMKSNKIVKVGIAHCPEGRQIWPAMTVGENLELGGYIYNSATCKSDIERMYKLFPILKERQKQLAGSLSGGEQQVLAVARALMSRPKLILFDEPSLGLSPKLASEILMLIKKLNVEEGISVLLVEQKAKMALKIANNGYVLEKGVVAMNDKAENLRDNDYVKKAYLGG